MNIAMNIFMLVMTEEYLNDVFMDTEEYYDYMRYNEPKLSLESRKKIRKSK